MKHTLWTNLVKEGELNSQTNSVPEISHGTHSHSLSAVETSDRTLPPPRSMLLNMIEVGVPVTTLEEYWVLFVFIFVWCHGAYSGLVVVSKLITRSTFLGYPLGFLWSYHPTGVGKIIGLFVIPCGKWFAESFNGSGWFIGLGGFLWKNLLQIVNQFRWISSSM